MYAMPFVYFISPSARKRGAHRLRRLPLTTGPTCAIRYIGADVTTMHRCEDRL
jgi:hypothetical protein